MTVSALKEWAIVCKGLEEGNANNSAKKRGDNGA